MPVTSVDIHVGARCKEAVIINLQVEIAAVESIILSASEEKEINVGLTTKQRVNDVMFVRLHTHEALLPLQ